MEVDNAVKKYAFPFFAQMNKYNQLILFTFHYNLYRYLCLMRFVLFLIISSFLFFSPLRGNGSDVLGRQLKTNIDNGNKTKQTDCSLSDDYAVAHINSNHRNSSTTQNRFYPFNNYIATIAFQNEINFFYEEKLFVQPHSYCKRIGLKLIFPEHYFW